MSSDLRRALGSFTTPEGRLVSPLYLNEPDSKFQPEQEKQKFKASILLEGTEGATFLARTEEAMSEWVSTVKQASGKKPRTVKKNVQWFTSDTERWDDIGESASRMLDSLDEGEAVFKTNTKAFRATREGVLEPAGPKFFDATGKLMAEVPPIGFGTRAKLAGSYYGYTTSGVANLTLLLSAVQIIELREPGAGGGPQEASDFGFSPTEGFTATEAAAADYDF
jgi:hypothetical protein